jgi:hypothetical protein
MEAMKQYLLPYIISNLLFVLCVSAAFKKQMWARIFLASLFLRAGWINRNSALKSPGIYLEYAKLTPVVLYKEFINGYFSSHIVQIILLVATFQFLIFI